jgi:hypothetical protein
MRALLCAVEQPAGDGRDRHGAAGAIDRTNRVLGFDAEQGADRISHEVTPARWEPSSTKTATLPPSRRASRRQPRVTPHASGMASVPGRESADVAEASHEHHT